MIGRSGEAFIPSVCPALEAEDTELYNNQGSSVMPSDMMVNLTNLDADYSRIVEEDQPPHSIHTYVWFGMASAVYANAVSESYRVDSPEAQVVDRMADDPNAEHKLGERYCTRVKECQGVFMRNGEPICQALDPEEFIPELHKLYPEA